MAKTIFAGYGRAGYELHMPCRQKAQSLTHDEMLFHPEIGVVDSCEQALAKVIPHVPYFRDIASARPYFGDDTVIHICTPPSAHLAVIRESAQHGYKRFIVEKPLASSLQELREIQALEKEYDLQITVVAPWLASTLTTRLQEIIDRDAQGMGWRLKINQIKPRFSRSLSNHSHQSAFDVEMPHQVALACHLAGASAEVQAATCSDMQVNGETVPHMGTATLQLQHLNGTVSTLFSDLMAPRRERSIEIDFEDGRRLVGHYPPDGMDHFSQLQIFDARGRLVSHELLFDDPLPAFFVTAYRYFKKGGITPISDLEFNASVLSILCEAKSRCGLLT